MIEKIGEPDLDLAEAHDHRDDYHRRNVGEIRAAVTRGATGIETSYFLEQGSFLNRAREPS